MSSAELLSRENNIARIKVVLDGETVDKTFREVYRILANQINVPGFRKGKIPPNVLRQRVGAEAVNSEVSDRLRDQAIELALEELKLTPRVGRPSFDEEAEPQAGTEAVYQFTLPVLPDVSLPDYKAFSIPVTRLQVTELMKKRYRDRIIERFTEYPAREDGAAAASMLIMDVHSKFAENGEESPFHSHSMVYKIGEEGNLPGWDEKLSGAKAGDKQEFSYVMPGDFADTRVAGKELLIELNVSAVHDTLVPELSEDFVKEKLQLEGLQQFEEFMQSSLTRESEQQFESLKRDKALQQVAEQLSAEISEDMISDELDGIVTEHDRELRQHGLSLDAYLQQSGKSLAEFRDERRDLAERRIRTFLAVKTIAEQEGIRATQDDLMQYMYLLMQRENVSQDQIRQLARNREFINETTYQIIRAKVLEHLVNTVSFEVSEGSEAQTNEALAALEEGEEA
ncbi:trigger factor [bacterium]|nr:trigger factor [bacterium]